MEYVKKNPTLIFILLTAILCYTLLKVRIVWSNENWFSFMTWNLFLGFIPLYTSSQLPGTTGTLSLLLLGITITFLPNAPYLITDLIHLHKHARVPLWYDGLMLFTFAATGLSWGIYSVYNIHKWLMNHIHTLLVWVSVLLIQLATGFGIYLGRIHRLNSWNIINNPEKLFELILKSFTQRECWMMSLAFGGLFMVLYIVAYTSIQHLKQQHYVIPQKNME